jgi:hypothetical protein
MLRMCWWLVVCFLSSGCVSNIERRTGPQIGAIDSAAPVLKLHLHNGVVYILEGWSIDENAREIVGIGQRLGGADGLFDPRFIEFRSLTSHSTRATLEGIQASHGS